MSLTDKQFSVVSDIRIMQNFYPNYPFSVPVFTILMFYITSIVVLH